ncbi:MAG: DHHA1 domain-containing protein, partial [Ruthenibacterium sp.]
VRRIEAATGKNVLTLLNDANASILKSAENLKASNPHELVAKSAQVMAELKSTERELEELNAKIAQAKANNLFAQAKELCGVKYVCASFTGTKPEAIRAMCDTIREKAPNMVGVLSTVIDGKASIFAACGKNTIEKGMHAGNLVRVICEMVGGKGGGRPDSAQGGATELFKIDEAFAQVPSLIEQMVGNK